MKKREHPPAIPGLLQWSEAEWEGIMLEARARYLTHSKVDSAWDETQHRVQRVAECHLAETFGVPRPDELTFHTTPFNSETLGAIKVVGFRLGIDHSWTWRGGDDVVAFVGVDERRMLSRYVGRFDPEQAVGQLAPLLVSLDTTNVDGTMAWSVPDVTREQLGLPGVEQPPDLWCYRCKKWKSPSEFHRNRNKADGVQSECKQCKSEMERDRLLRLGKPS